MSMKRKMPLKQEPVDYAVVFKEIFRNYNQRQKIKELSKEIQPEIEIIVTKISDFIATRFLEKR